ncbi:transcriptional regulator, TetR family [Geodermatophilus pulveris]|uniref:Transcriptional regulator, TetR family n=1 Tax=Geodermatophilus pulveris TaxID=1564159 RepID=A0A239FG63_9ACTN|nr:TetR family transcriptional regulator [Geodermatophilus pulveris]SNS55518.1 transcriptional regulator, TetR family [Geodermatophilus pulveris]
MAEGRGRPEQRAAFLSGAVEHVLRHGVATLSLRPLAAALGTSDRMLLSYFGSREQLLAAVLGVVGEQLQARFAAGLPAHPVSPAALVRELATALRDPAAEAPLRLYVEVGGLAARGHEPHRAVAAAVAGGWLSWLGSRLDVPDAERADAAAGVLAVVDGLLLVRFLAPGPAADRAAGWLAGRLGYPGG